MNTTTYLVLRPVDQLVPYAQHARQHSAEQLLQLRFSLREFGWIVPPLICSCGQLITGSARLLAAQADGIKLVPCLLAEHLRAPERMRCAFADRYLAEHPCWDEALVRRVIDYLDNGGLAFGARDCGADIFFKGERDLFGD